MKQLNQSLDDPVVSRPHRCRGRALYSKLESPAIFEQPIGFSRPGVNTTADVTAARALILSKLGAASAAASATPEGLHGEIRTGFAMDLDDFFKDRRAKPSGSPPEIV
ncbi:hypothetical protein [Rhodoplanes sp. Z2-YC6860]|uniref:hypothetical protein n=1 Tax=Rhodoplanes sp. Z2-YC6860 TaxID=674703 RepID=UPI0012ED52FC|nr:hypothetical protein [Rhodoplanes sp. Z2-YC6860]